jgi:hypothetical protein
MFTYFGSTSGATRIVRLIGIVKCATCGVKACGMCKLSSKMYDVHIMDKWVGLFE